MVQGENTVVVEYEIDAADCELEVRPLLALRDYHVLQQAHSLDTSSLHFEHDGAEEDQVGDWYYGFDYERERERGFPSSEDLYHPFTLRFRSQQARLIASTEPDRKMAAPRAEMQRCEQFIVKRGEFHSILAGYHWFVDWGRDAMISLTGLTLATGRYDVAKSILQAFASVVSEGMLPNRFPDSGENPEYNTIDATLWFFEAARSYLDFTGDQAFIMERIYPVLREITDWHLRGTRYGIHMDTDGLLQCDGAQLTWMDTSATPRAGKAVEIQALWHNALRILEQLGDTRCGDLAKHTAESFREKFWNEQTGCLFDVLGDASIRPNQLFAISLRHPLIEGDRAESILKVVERDLLTPVGLRTLSPHDPHYQGRYEGPPAQRDAAYHQGTIWPWLLGAWIDACKKTRGSADFNFKDTGLIPEIFDGDAPHTPRGCIAQAWSLGELIRAGLVDAKINA
jgi:glycogen debranching enzyme